MVARCAKTPYIYLHMQRLRSDQVHPDRGLQALTVVETIERRMNRVERIAEPEAGTPDPHPAQSMTEPPSSISHAHFAALSSRLAQVAAKASADAVSPPACAYDPMPADVVLRLLTDVRRMADAIAALSAGGVA
jgi:hypothetical protein